MRRRNGTLLALLAFVALQACHRAPGVEREGSGVIASSSSSLGTHVRADERATLRLGPPPGGPTRGALAATEFEVGVARAVDGPQVVVRLLSGGEVLEREVYDSRAEAYRVVATDDESFAPPLDLVRYPARDGAAWTWEGKVVYGGISRAARAQITLSRDGGDLRSAVALAVVADPGRPELKRNLAFWFRKDVGVVRRAFGDVTSRRPLGEPFGEGPWRP